MKKVKSFIAVFCLVGLGVMFSGYGLNAQSPPEEVCTSNTAGGFTSHTVPGGVIYVCNGAPLDCIVSLIVPCPPE